MRPTVDEHLAGIDRLLEQVAADPAGSESTLLVRDARRQLGRLRGSIDLRLPFLHWDNAASLEALQAVAPQLPADLASRVAAVSSEATEPVSDEAETRAAERNDVLRELLGQAIDALSDPEAEPETDAIRAAHRLIVDHLRTRTEANPALNKHPTIPGHPTSE